MFDIKKDKYLKNIKITHTNSSSFKQKCFYVFFLCVTKHKEKHTEEEEEDNL